MRSRRIDVYFYIYVSQNIYLSNTKYVCEFIESNYLTSILYTWQSTWNTEVQIVDKAVSGHLHPT